MLKRLRRKLVILSMLCAALMAVSSASASSSTSRILIYFDVPEGCIGNQKYCCDRQADFCGCVP